MSTSAIVGIIITLVIIIVAVIVAVLIWYNNKNKTQQTTTNSSSSSSSSTAERVPNNQAKAGSSTASTVDNTAAADKKAREQFPEVYIAFPSTSISADEPFTHKLEFLSKDFNITTNVEEAAVFEIEGDKLWYADQYLTDNGMSKDVTKAISITSDNYSDAEYDFYKLLKAIIRVLPEADVIRMFGGVAKEDHPNNSVALLTLVDIVNDMNVNISNNEVKEPLRAYTFYNIFQPKVEVEQVNVTDIPEKNPSLNTSIDLRNVAANSYAISGFSVTSLTPDENGKYKTDKRYGIYTQYKDERVQLVVGSKESKDYALTKLYNIVRYIDGYCSIDDYFNPLSIERGVITYKNSMFNAPIPIETEPEHGKWRHFTSYNQGIPYYASVTNYVDKVEPYFYYEYDGRRYKVMPDTDLLYRINQDNTMYVLVQWDNGEIEEVPYNVSRVNNNNITTHGITIEKMFELYPDTYYADVDFEELEDKIEAVEKIRKHQEDIEYGEDKRVAELVVMVGEIMIKNNQLTSDETKEVQELKERLLKYEKSTRKSMYDDEDEYVDKSKEKRPVEVLPDEELTE